MKCLTAHDLPAEVQRLILLHSDIDDRMVHLQSHGRKAMVFAPSWWAGLTRTEALFIETYLGLNHMVVQLSKETT